MKIHIRSAFSAALAGLFLLNAVSCTADVPAADAGSSTDTVGTAAVDTAPAVREPARADVYVDASAAPGGDGTEGSPFASITEARDYLRASDKSAVSGGITVHVAPGEYRNDGALSFTAEDSGTEDCPITYISDVPLAASIRSGVALDNSAFTAIDEGERARLFSPEAGDHIRKIDLRAQGLTDEDWGALAARSTWDMDQLRSYGIPTTAEGELYVNGDRSFLAQYPNDALLSIDGFLRFRTIVEDVLSMDPAAEDLRGSTFTVDDETARHLAVWQEPEKAWVFGYFRWEWADHAVPVGGVDLSANSVTLAVPCGEHLVQNYKYMFYNVFEELDRPGEYYIDRDNGVLYLYAGDTFDTDELVFANSHDPLISGAGLDWVTFRGFDIRYSRSSGISLSGNHITFDGCSIGSVRTEGISLKGNFNSIVGCDVSNIGGQAIYMEGGDQETLTSSENLIYNNRVHDFGQIKRTYAYGIFPGSVGTTVSHNEIYNAPHNAVSTGSMNNIIEYNEIYNVCAETEDCAAIYNGFSFMGRGNVIRYNYIHDIGQENTHTHAIYMDSSYSGQTIVGNIFENTGYYAIKAASGRDNVISNNIYINCSSREMEFGVVHFGQVNRDEWLAGVPIESVISNAFMGMDPSQLITYDNAAWREAFPQIYETKTVFDPAVDSKDDPAFFPNPTGNIITKNVVFANYGSRKVHWTHCFDLGADVETFSTVEDNVTINNDMSSFADPDNKDYTLVEGSAIFASVPDFEPIPFAKIGCVD